MFFTKNTLKTIINGVLCKVKSFHGDWNENDEASPNYIKNRTHWEEEKESDISVIEEITHIWENLDFEDVLVIDEIELIENKTYDVYWDGKLYKCTPYIAEYAGICLGNDIIGGAGTNGGNNEPFFIIPWRGATLIFTDTIGEHTFSVSVTGIQTVVHKLDPKYLPDDIGLQPDWNQLDDTKKDSIKNRPPLTHDEDGNVYLGSFDDMENAKKLATEEYFYEPKKHLVLEDEVNGYRYLISMKNGNLMSYIETASIKVTKMPDIIRYWNGEEFNPKGMIITAIGVDGSERELNTYEYDRIVTNDNYDNFCLRYNELGNIFECYLSLNIYDFSLIDFDYIRNDDGTFELTDWKGTYNGEPSTRIVVPDSELIIL